MNSAALVYRLVRYRKGIVTSLFVLFFLVGFTSSGIAIIQATSARAAHDAVTHAAGGYPYAVTVSDSTSSLSSEMRRLGATPLWLESVDIETLTGRTSVEATLFDRSDMPLPLYPLSSGRWVDGISEIVVSEAVAAELDLVLGDSVTSVSEEGQRLAPRRVVGIGAIPTDSAAMRVSYQTDSSDDGHANTWLFDRPPHSQASLQESFTSGVIAMRTTEILAGDEEEQARLTTFPAIRGLWWGASIAGLAMAMFLVAGLSGISKKTRLALVAAGMLPAAANRLLMSAYLSVIILSAVAGSGGAAVTIFAARKKVAQLVGQNWIHISLPWFTITLYAVSIVVCAIAAGWLFRDRRYAGPDLGSKISPKVVLTFLVFGVAIGIAILIFANTQVISYKVAPLGALLCTALVGPLCLFFVSRSGGAAYRKYLIRLAVPFVLLATLAGGLATVSAAYSAYQARVLSAAAAMSSPMQPHGSLVALRIPDRTALEIAADYASTRIFSIPREDATLIRVTTPTLADCLRSGMAIDEAAWSADCVTTSAATIVAPIAMSDTVTKPRADPALIVNGSIELLSFSGAPEDEYAEPSIVRKLDVDPDPELGGSLPGLVVPDDDPLLAELDIEDSGSNILLLRDFHSLEASERGVLRGTIVHAAPSALLNDVSSSYESDRVGVRVLAVATAVFVLAILLLGGRALISGLARQRLVVDDLGATAGVRRILMVKWFAGPVATMIVAGATGYCAASARSVPTLGDPDAYWLAAPLAGLVSVLMIGISFWKRPIGKGK